MRAQSLNCKRGCEIARPKPNSDCRATERKHPWPMVRLGDVCELKNGYTPSASMLSEKEGIPYFRVSAMNFSGNEKFLKVPNAYCVDQGKRVFPAGAVVFPKNGGAAQTHKVRVLANESIVDLNTGLAIPRECICSEYLYYWFEDLPINDYIIVGAIPFVDFGMLGDRKIPLPPLSVQREIVARLERELAAVEKMKKGFEALAETAKAEFKSELKEVFEEISRGGAETRRLGDTFRFIDYRGMTPNKIATGVPLITAKNIRFGYMDYRERFYISEEDYAKRQTRGVARCGDILFTTEAPMGYVALADQKRFSTGQRIITFQWPNATEHNNRYFLYYFMSDVFQDQVRENASGATAQGIKSSRLVNLSVLIPECQKQSQVVARLDSAKARAEKLEAKAREGVAVCETMRKAILKEAFEGTD